MGRRNNNSPETIGARFGSPSTIRAARKKARSERSKRKRGGREKIERRPEPRSSKRTKPKRKKPPKSQRVQSGSSWVEYAAQLVWRGLLGIGRWVGAAFLWDGAVDEGARRDEHKALPKRWRFIVIGTLFFLAGGSIVGRAVELQLLNGQRYVDAAERQATTSAHVKAKRGVIKDRHGSELAITVDVDSVFAEPRRLENPAATAKALAPILSITKKALQEKLSADRAFVYLRRRIDAQTAKRVRDLKIKGVSTRPEPKRFYSNIGLGAHVLGFTGWDGVGKSGVERTFDGMLRGKSYEAPGLRDALGNRVYSDGLVPDSVLEGADIVLTLDRTIQHAAEEALAEAVAQFKAKAGVAIVMEPKTGDVLALASVPTFNPNNLRKTTASDRKNRAVSSVYEPGSTVKMVTVAAALEAGLIRKSDQIDCEGGKWRVGGRTIGDSDHAYGRLSISEILQKSSNICAAKIGLHLGRARLSRWLRAFGFGSKTGIELPGEVRGLIRPHDQWREIALANIAFGQGIAVTPLQIAVAASVIANGGKMQPPRLIRSITEKSGQGQTPPRPKAVRVLSEKTASTVAQMMESVTKTGGTAVKAAVPGFSVAGKTGTAQKIDPVTRAYSHELYVSSFVGFVPAEDPQFTILVLIDEPKGSIYGGTVAAPAFRKIALAALSAREMFPDEPKARRHFLASHPAAAPTPDVDFEKAGLLEEPAGLEAAQVAEIKNEMSGDGSMALTLSDEAQDLLGVVVRDGPPVPAPAAKTTIAGRMPNFRGLQVHEVLNQTAEIPCDPVIIGSGRVVSQSPKAGTRIGVNARCEVRLSPRG